MGVSSKPPALAISVARASRDRLKDTAQNILDTGVFTVSMVSSDCLQRMVDTSASWSPEVSEFEALSLELKEGSQVAAPWPVAAKVAMECRLVHAHDMGTTHLLVGEIEVFHIDESVVQFDPDGNPLIQASRLDPVARLGGQEYTVLGSVQSASPCEPTR